ncbi:arginine N-succinyltransferase [Pokkaliibacter plantistimulans]|uniref:Arginine N-succinyltransferase n=1 Tax=Proteobacteria bacterium 228 TaxID=2083153 RepID=A0A2S5KR86_9PROT|nr:arginine N-succinyltransferase [Pokkaliibacter plantistimulans]PPC76776.1 arginine N-succinyltransferase [Pokkaliibacter plantistimulans]
MMFVRPVDRGDMQALLALARKTGVGFTSLQPDENKIRERLLRAEATLRGELEPADQGYLFALEDSTSGKVVGICGIEVAVGLKEPWYNFRLGKLSQMSRELGVNQQLDVLFLSNDHAGYSELCTLFLDPDWRHSRNGQLLSKSRLLFIAAFRQRFARKLVAEMRGVSDEQGNSPFWEGVGRHFFNIDFARADYLTGIGEKTFIAELMPRFPVYIPLLASSAQQAIGKVHPHTAPARAMLEAEGLRYEGYVDIFDGGATLEAYIDELRIVRDSRLYHCEHRDDVAFTTATRPYLLSNDAGLGFRAIQAELPVSFEVLPLTSSQLLALGVEPGAMVRSVPLSPC